MSSGIICLEAELPADDLARRRIGFYKRNGFVVNGYDYVQPPYEEGKSSIPMKILSYGRPLKEDEFNKIKLLIYKEVYNFQII